MGTSTRRRQAFGWAILLILGGVGWTFSTIVISQSSPIGWLADTFSFGFLPVLLGLGIFVHALISRRD